MKAIIQTPLVDALLSAWLTKKPVIDAQGRIYRVAITPYGSGVQLALEQVASRFPKICREARRESLKR